MQVPDDLKYTTEHEWVKPEGKTVVVGITDFAQDSLGDIVYVQLPQVGSKFESGATLGEIESTKSVSDIYCPVSGTVTEINLSLNDSPEVINSDPYVAGWLCKVEIDNESDLESLLTAEDYSKLTES